MTLRYGSLVSSLRSLRGDPGVTIVTPTYADLRYREGLLRRSAIAPLADVYVPERPNGASVLLVHGGAFVLGSRRMKPMRYLSAKLVDAGIAVCAIDYRMIFRGGRIDEATTDVLDGFEFWSTKLVELGLDPLRVSIVGLSAGATLAMLAAAQLDDARLGGVVSCFGLYDAAHLRGPGTLLPRLLFRSAERARWSARLPGAVRQTAAPTLLLHGTEDGLVPVAQAQQLAARRESAGLPTKLVIYDGAPHGFFNLPVPEAAAGAREIVEHVTRARVAADAVRTALR